MPLDGLVLLVPEVAAGDPVALPVALPDVELPVVGDPAVAPVAAPGDIELVEPERICALVRMNCCPSRFPVVLLDVLPLVPVVPGMFPLCRQPTTVTELSLWRDRS